VKYCKVEFMCDWYPNDTSKCPHRVLDKYRDCIYENIIAENYAICGSEEAQREAMEAHKLRTTGQVSQ